MKTVKTLFFAFAVGTFMISCGQSKEKLRTSIESAEARLYKDEMRLPSKVVADSVVNLYSEFAKQFPEDTMSPDYLFRAGDLYYSVKEFPQAIASFGLIQQKYSNYKKAPLALFTGIYCRKWDVGCERSKGIL